MTTNVILKRCGMSDLHLPPFARMILPVLDHLSRGHSCCLSGARAIARLAGCCARTVQRAIQVLEAAGLVVVLRDYDLRTRRRIRLLWRPEDQPPQRHINAQVGANLCSQTAFPPDPPIEAVETNQGMGGGGERAQTKAAPSPCVTPPPPQDPNKSETRDDRKDGRRAATPEEIRSLLDQGKRVMPDVPERKFRGLARQFGLRLVRSALARAERRKQADGEVGTGYLITVLRGFVAEGYVPADVADPDATARKVDREIAESARLAALAQQWRQEYEDRLKRA